MNKSTTLIAQERYIRDHNYIKMYGLNLYCCEWNFYRNSVYYLQHFICHIYKN